MSRIALVPLFTIKHGCADEFLRHVLAQRDNCLRDEPGCRHFDVLRHPDDEHRILLYEIYADDAAIAAHRQTPHYARFKAATADLVESLELVQWRIEE